MDLRVQDANNEAKNSVEIVVHVTEELDEGQRSDVVSELKNINGITNAEFCPLRYHLMLVRYDTDVFSSQDVLNSVNLQHVRARLIGPI